MDTLIQFHRNHGAELEEIEGITIPIRYVNRFQEERQTRPHKNHKPPQKSQNPHKNHKTP